MILRFGVAGPRIAARTAAGIGIAGISHRSILKACRFFASQANQPRGSLLGGHFGPEKKYLAPAPPKNPQFAADTLPAPRPLLGDLPALLGFSIKNRPPPSRRPRTPPSPSPSQKNKKYPKRPQGLNGGVTNGGLRGVWPPVLEIGRNRPFSPFFCLFCSFQEGPNSTWKIQKTEEKGLFPQISSDFLEPPSLKPPFAALQFPESSELFS